MDERIIRRYSEAFKQQVVSALENGRFTSIGEAEAHYGITGRGTVPRWLRQYGKNHLQAKVVRVQKPDEADRIRHFKEQVAQLEQALGRTQAQNVLNEEYLKLACRELGQDVESFKKNARGRLCMRPPKSRT
jgi:transposase-like protein